jgi:hypothetical protein
MTTAELLEALFRRNESDPEHGPQVRSGPESEVSQISTLAGTRRSLSPMIRARFEYAGTWENVNLDQTWLSLSQIEKVDTNHQALEWIRLRRENWEHCPPANVAAEEVSLFGINPFEPEETYLVWRNNTIEPEVWRFFGADYKMFANIDSFLNYLLGFQLSDDSGRS